MSPFFIIELKADFSLEDCVEFLNAITENGAKTFRNLYVALPFFRLREIIKAFPDSGITFGSAMINAADPGAFTASIAGKMVKDAGGTFTLIGTRYERERLGLTDEQLKNKIQEALASGLKPLYAISGKNLEHQLQVLKETAEIDRPTIIYQLDFKEFKDYLPTQEELEQAKEDLKQIVDPIFPSSAILVALPSDLMGFSALIESLPFDGAFFIKSGTYRHAVRSETVKLVHVHCEEEITQEEVNKE